MPAAARFAASSKLLAYSAHGAVPIDPTVSAAGPPRHAGLRAFTEAIAWWGAGMDAGIYVLCTEARSSRSRE